MQIQKVNFVKVEYDKPFSHDIKAIAKIYASDHIIIDGVLLYTPSGSNEDEDYFDAHNQYWGNFENIWVKYPKTCSIENEVKRNFAYEIIDQYWKFLFTLELQQKNAELLELTEEQWKESSKSLEVYWLDKYIDKIDISIACKENPNITEEFIRKYLHKIDFLALGENFSVLRSLSSYFKRKFRHKLYLTSLSEHDSWMTYQRIEEELRINGAFEDDEPYDGNHTNSNYDLDDFRVTRKVSRNRSWYPEPTEEEMDDIVSNYTQVDWDNVSAVWTLQWLERYEADVNWSIICEENKHLNEEFLTKFYTKIDFEALSLNEFVKVPLSFIEKNLSKFNSSKPVPCIIRVLTYDFAEKNKDKITLDEESLDVFSSFYNGTEEEREKLSQLFNLNLCDPF